VKALEGFAQAQGEEGLVGLAVEEVSVRIDTCLIRGFLNNK
jgi:hypothetical protein